MTFEQAVKQLAPTCPFTGKPIDPADLIETFELVPCNDTVFFLLLKIAVDCAPLVPDR